MAWSRLFKFMLPAAILCTSAAGCGNSSPSLATADAARLHRDVASIRAAANGHNPAAAHTAVRTLEADISELRAANRLAPADAEILLSDAGQADRRVALEVRARAAPAPATTTTTAGPATTPPAPGPGHGKHGKGKGHDNGDGQGGGGDGGDGGD
jgi:hypothetical protein